MISATHSSHHSNAMLLNGAKIIHSALSAAVIRSLMLG